MWHAGYLKHIEMFISTAQKYYPASLFRSYILNAPYLFNGVWYVIREFLEPQVVARVFMLSADREAMRAAYEKAAITAADKKIDFMSPRIDSLHYRNSTNEEVLAGFVQEIPAEFWLESRGGEMWD